MIIIRGNSTKSRISLDVDFDSFLLMNTLTQEYTSFPDVIPTNRGGLYYQALLDFTGLEFGEYKYVATKHGTVVQYGLLVIEPFDEYEEPVQVIVPELEKKIITYTN